MTLAINSGPALGAEAGVTPSDVLGAGPELTFAEFAEEIGIDEDSLEWVGKTRADALRSKAGIGSFWCSSKQSPWWQEVRLWWDGASFYITNERLGGKPETGLPLTKTLRCSVCGYTHIAKVASPFAFFNSVREENYKRKEDPLGDGYVMMYWDVPILLTCNPNQVSRFNAMVETILSTERRPCPTCISVRLPRTKELERIDRQLETLLMRREKVVDALQRAPRSCRKANFYSLSAAAAAFLKMKHETPTKEPN